MKITLNYNSIEQLVEVAKSQNLKISQMVLQDQAKQMDLTEEEVYNKMKQSFDVMKACIEPGTNKDLRSTSGLTGGSAFLMQQAVENNATICGNVFGSALTKALAVSEFNASMGKIVAAPTAGSCGILPAAVLSIMESKNLSEKECVMSLFTASAVGMVIAKNASLAGAEGGCQAECGSASAMAAASLVELAGGDVDMISNAVACAIKNILGLVCDPVAGLVEIPCIKRNAGGVANALVAAELALAGITSAIPADEVIHAMRKVGNAMSNTLKETAEGGLATTPTGQMLNMKIFGNASKGTCNKCK